jgi:hypothetical protein
MLLDEPVEILAFLLVLFVLQGGLRFYSRIGQTIQVTEFEALGAIYIILKRGL